MRKLVIPKYYGRPSIGLALFGCANRPFYHVCVFPDRALGRRYESNIIEQVGTFDPLPNSRNEKLVSLNFGRLKYWIGERNAHISVPVLELLGWFSAFRCHIFKPDSGQEELSISCHSLSVETLSKYIAVHNHFNGSSFSLG
ncbi:unnamed protein product [Heligmosomoides polygyrus]|uniref:Small ribosomal subunit protein bS16m n=1 Tax=Heligmosomoides polygyrus TaxID=6339 RepID=A0A183GK70_HELPZ|nr:unnamed protein product [Heligmosomoides polygyrus]